MAAQLTQHDDRVLYLYGISESLPAKIPPEIGVALAKIETVDCGGIVCWVSWVPGKDFEQNLVRNMENLDWLAEASVAHQRAVSAIAKQTEVLPARFGTVFRSETSLRQHVRSRRRHLKRDFERVRGADEWGVKVFGIPLQSAPVPKVHSGKDYLKARAALLPKRRAAQNANGDLQKFEDALKRVARETAKVGNISSGQRGLAFQTSLLVKRRDQRKLESVLKKFSESWENRRRIECTGPWPPYSFVSRTEGEESE
jgi:hypothetical protein